jgi:NAD(P)-dependent dehydrogenase (short-subunit alcohol dehydrogenase family)
MTMKDKIVLVTGANGGLGYETSKALAAQGAEIVMLCRDAKRGEAAKREIAKLATGRPPTLFIGDVSSQASVRAVSKEIHARYQRLDVLLNNAGALFGEREITTEGVERTLATNHIGPFLLTHLLLDLVRAAPQGRIVNVETEIYASKLDFENLQGEKKYSFFTAYRHSKLANVMVTFELARRLQGTGVTVNALGPGPAKTNAGHDVTGAPGMFLRFMRSTPIFKDPKLAARTAVYVASSPDLARVTGKFFFKGREIKTKPITQDKAAAARLWSITEQLCGLKASA